MTLIIVLLVFAIEFYFNWGAQYRSTDWFSRYHKLILGWLGEHQFYQGWGGIACLLGAPLLLLMILLIGLEGNVYSLFLFIISLVALFFSLGPKPLSQSLEAYFSAMQRGDAEGAYFSLEQENVLENFPQSDELVRNVTRAILIEAQTRYFGVIFWFIFLGPYGAIFYRLAHEYAATERGADNEHCDKLALLLHWIDWLPARLTSILFLLTGDFVNGFHRVKDSLIDFNADNRQIISETGLAALGLEMAVSEGDVQENRHAYAMVERTLILYVVAVAALSPLAFW